MPDLETLLAVACPRRTVPPSGVQQTTSVRVPMLAGANTVKVSNDAESAPDLDRLSLAWRRVSRVAGSGTSLLRAPL
jgi:hypothetical protein